MLELREGDNPNIITRAVINKTAYVRINPVYIATVYCIQSLVDAFSDDLAQIHPELIRPVLLTGITAYDRALIREVKILRKKAAKHVKKHDYLFYVSGQPKYLHWGEMTESQLYEIFSDRVRANDRVKHWIKHNSRLNRLWNE